MKVEVALQPSQWATSFALESEELRATMRMGRSIWEEMYRIREPLYKRWNDWFINNYETAEEAVWQIMNVLEL